MSRKSILFSVLNRPGALKDALSIFQKHSLNLARIVSRPSRQKTTFDFVVDIDEDIPEEKIENVLSDLKPKCKKVDFIGSKEAPWFPTRIQDLDLFSRKVLEAGGELEADHPGFKDEVYRERRKMIAEIAKNHKFGQKIPTVDYTKEEIETWRLVYRRLTSMYPKYACKQLNYVFPLLEQNCGYSENNIPQLEDVSSFLKDATGWQIKPVAGLLSARDFLNGLAFRVFHSTQYIRHHSRPFYTPEPDVCHELLGHVPLFADPDFADFSQELGLASIGVSDEAIEKLIRCYWYTVEFGLCLENGERKAYGAGLLSSFGELEYAMTDKPEILPFDPHVAAEKEYPITTYQPTYFISPSFDQAKKQMREFAKTLDRPFSIRYNPFTQRIEVLDTRKKLINLAEAINTQLSTLTQALHKIDSTMLDEDPLD